MNQKGFAPLLLIIFIACAIGLGIQYIGKQNVTIQPIHTPAMVDSNPVSLTTSIPSPTAVSNTALKSDEKPLGSYTSWKTYSDSKAGFSVQYAPVDEVIDKKEGEYVYFTSFRITVYSDYNGGSRREWLNSKFDLSSYDVTYEDYVVSGVNALIAKASDPGSMGTTFVVIPTGNKVYLVATPSGQEDLSGVKKIISTFKFI